MFVQVIQGRVSDRQQAEAAVRRYAAELGPGSGWLGSTTGVTDDGTLISLARFESAEAAGTSSSRAEHRQWWTETKQLFVEGPTVRSCSQVFSDVDPLPEAAGFVQVMQGETRDPARSLVLMRQTLPRMTLVRSDVTGRLAVLHDGGSTFTMAVYFESEAAARQGERITAPPPADLVAELGEMQSLLVGGFTYFDLKDPWLTSPA
jgi:hypothetical protein